MKTIVTLPKEYPIHKDLEFVFDDEQWDNYQLKESLYNILERNNSEEMSSTRSGTTSYLMLTSAVRDGKFSKRELKMLKDSMEEIRSKVNTLGRMVLEEIEEGLIK